MAKNEDKLDGEKIRDIAERVMKNEFSDDARITPGGATEYKFSSLPRTSLEFVDTEEPEDDGQDAQQITAVPEENGFDPFMDDGGIDAAAELPIEDMPISDDDFDIPDAFVMSEEYSEMDDFDMAPRVWKTYVPRFTEVTERSYTMRDPNAQTPTRVTAEEPENTVETTPTVTVDRVSAGEADPTLAEIDGDADAVIVNVDRSERDRRDTINVFKFGKREELPTVEITEEEQQRRDISALTGHKWETKVKLEEEAPEYEAPHLHDTYEDEEVHGYIDDEPVVAEELHEEYLEPEDDDELPVNERPLGWDYNPIRDVHPGSGEYDNYSLREKFKDKFLDIILSLRLRMIVAALIGVVALVIDNIAFFPNMMYRLGITSSSATLAVFDGTIVGVLFLLTLPETLHALRAVVYGRVLPELSLPISAITILVYDIVILVKLPEDYPLFAFVYSIMAFIAIAGAYALENTHFAAFRNISNKRTKRVLDIRLTRTLERENLALDGVVDEYKSKLARDFKAVFVSDFKRRTQDTQENSQNNLTLLLLAFGMAILTGAVMFFIGNGIVDAFSAIVTVSLFSLPAFSLLSHKLTFRHSQSEAECGGSSFIGEASIRELAAVDCLAFLDTEIFGKDDVSFKSISISDKEGNYSKTMRRVSSLFSAVGGPLSELFYSSLGKRFEPAEDVEIENDGASGIVDGVRIIAGSVDYMQRHGVRVVPERTAFAPSTKVMYAAEDGVLFAKFNIQYNFSEEFARSIPILRQYGISPLLYTRDPNINNELVRFLTGGNDIIRVMKRSTVMPREEKVYSRLSSGLVTHGDKYDIVNALTLAKRYCHTMSNITLTELTAGAVGAVLAVMIVTMKMTSFLPIVLVGAWQICWAVVMSIVSRGNFDIRRKKTRKNQKRNI